jgi:hypothetical protein
MIVSNVGEPEFSRAKQQLVIGKFCCSRGARGFGRLKYCLSAGLPSKTSQGFHSQSRVHLRRIVGSPLGWRLPFKRGQDRAWGGPGPRGQGRDDGACDLRLVVFVLRSSEKMHCRPCGFDSGVSAFSSFQPTEWRFCQHALRTAICGRRRTLRPSRGGTRGRSKKMRSCDG